MDFLKKIFGGTDSHEGHNEEGGFKCENCGENRSESHRKAPELGQEKEKKNVCEYC